MSGTDNIDLDRLNYVVKVPYNGTGATGGNPLEQNLNIWYEVGAVLPPSCLRPAPSARQRDVF
jgi:hypothetical protein